MLPAGKLPTLALTLALLSIPSAPAGAPGPPRQHPWDGARQLASNGGTYILALRSEPEPIPENEPFAVAVWVLDAARPDSPLAASAESATAAMPEHGHGMNRQATVSRRDDGGFDVRGMMLHMGGTWELYLDVTRGPLTERAQLTVKLE